MESENHSCCPLNRQSRKKGALTETKKSFFVPKFLRKMNAESHHFLKCVLGRDATNKRIFSKLVLYLPFRGKD